MLDDKLDIIDQRFNDTVLISAVNTTSNIQSLGFNITSQLSNLFYSVSNPSGFLNSSGVVFAVGNWSNDKFNYNTTTQLSSLFLSVSDEVPLLIT